MDRLDPAARGIVVPGNFDLEVQLLVQDGLLYFAMYCEIDYSAQLRMSWLAVYFEVCVTLGHNAKCLPARFDNFEAAIRARDSG